MSYIKEEIFPTKKNKNYIQTNKKDPLIDLAFKIPINSHANTVDPRYYQISNQLRSKYITINNITEIEKKLLFLIKKNLKTDQYNLEKKTIISGILNYLRTGIYMNRHINKTKLINDMVHILYQKVYNQIISRRFVNFRKMHQKSLRRFNILKPQNNIYEDQDPIRFNLSGNNFDAYSNTKPIKWSRI